MQGHAVAFLRKGKYLIQGTTRTDQSMRVIYGTVYIADEQDDQHLGEYVIKALEPQKVIPHPSYGAAGWKVIQEPTLNAAGVKSLRTLYKGAKGVGIELDEEGMVSFTPTAKGKTIGEGIDLEDKMIKCRLDAEELRKALIEAFSHCSLLG